MKNLGHPKFRYQLAEEILARGGTNAEIQAGIMRQFRNSRPNPGRAGWYRWSWERFGHCHGSRWSRERCGHGR